MKSGYFFFNTILLSMLLFTACKADDTLTPVVVFDDGDLIGNWKFTGVIVNDVDVSNTLGTCLMDDMLIFDMDAVFTHTTGTNKCNITNTDKKGAWELSSDKKTLTTIVNSNEQILTVMPLSATTLKLMFISPEVIDGVTLDREYEITIVKQ